MNPQRRSLRGWLLITCFGAAAGLSASGGRHSGAEAMGVAGHAGAGVGSSSALPAAPNAAAAVEFMAAMQRTRTGAGPQEPPDSAALKAFPIYDYLVAARLRRDLTWTPSEDLDTAIDAFLKAHEGEPVARALRRQWLASLAERQRWDWFLARAADVTDPVLICDRLQGRLATGDTEKLAVEALARWNLVQRPPAECATVFAWLHAQGAVTPALQEARARAALGADNVALAREFVAEVPAERAAPLKQWLELIESPRPALGALAQTPTAAVEPEALLAGFTRLANTDYAAAAAVLPALLTRPDSTQAQRDKLARASALGAAYARQPDAVGAFDRADGGTRRRARAGMAGARRALGRQLRQGARLAARHARESRHPAALALLARARHGRPQGRR